MHFSIHAEQCSENTYIWINVYFYLIYEKNASKLLTFMMYSICYFFFQKNRGESFSAIVHLAYESM